MRNWLLSVVLVAVLLGADANVLSQQVFCKLEGNIQDSDWAFTYASWAGPGSFVDAVKYSFKFINRTKHNVPVRWPDAKIIHAKTIPNKDLLADFDALPNAKPRDSKIEVGPEGAESRPYIQKVCLSDARPDQTQQQVRLQKFLATRFKLFGAIAGSGSHQVSVDVEFRSSATRFPGEITYQLLSRSPKLLRVYWDVPQITNRFRTVESSERGLSFGATKATEAQLISTFAIIADPTEEILAILSLPVLSGR